MATGNTSAVNGGRNVSNIQDKATVQLQAREELKRREAMRDKFESEHSESELYAIIKATNRENPSRGDIERLRTYLEQHPDEVEKLGNLANHVETQVLESAFNSVLTKKATYMHMADMRVAMGYDAASAVEKGLIDNIVLCWLRLHICEFHYEKYTVNASIDRALFWEKVLSATQKRYLRSVEALARIRKLQQPAPNPLTLALVKAQVNGTEPKPKSLKKWLK